MVHRSSTILHFRDIDASSLPLVGGKGANLGEMTQAGFPVPQGFCVSTGAYKTVVSGDAGFIKLTNLLDDLAADDTDRIRTIAEDIRRHIGSLAMPRDICESIVQAWRETGEGKSYAVRSSATAEDLASASFAGQQDTYLNIRGEEVLLQSIRNCWASLFTERAVLYRMKNGFQHTSVLLSVVVQEMVFSDVSGIMFTADPISGNRKILSINASFGLGEALVSGLVQADLYKVSEGRIIQKEIAPKKLQIVSQESGGTSQATISEDQQSSQALTDMQILELSDLGRKIEKHYRREQDIEWCLKDGRFFIVQSRPITSLYPLPEGELEGLHFFVSVGHMQMMTEAMRPLGYSIFQTFSKYVERVFGIGQPLLAEAGNRLYIDLMNPLRYSVFQKILPVFLSNADESVSVMLRQFMEREDFRKIGRRNISWSRIFRILPFFFREIQLFWFGDFSGMFEVLNDSVAKRIGNFKITIQNAPEKEKIRTIRTALENLPKDIFETGILQYMPVAMGSYKILGTLSRKWLGDTNEIDAIGKAPEGNVTTQMGLLLGDLTDMVREQPRMLEYLESARDSDFWEELERIEGGKPFQEALRRFFDMYGMRCTGEIDITRTRWKEQPTQVISLILNIAKNTRKGQHREEFLLARSDAMKSNELLLQRVRGTYFGFVKSMIMKRLALVYRATIGVREHPKFFLINMFGIMRDAILDEAKKLIPEAPEDIFYFTLDEIGIMIESGFADTKELEERKIRFQQNSTLKPPRVFSGDGEILVVRSDVPAIPGALYGTAASAGTVEGRARVVLRLEDADLEKGDILVTPYTDPAWTTLFGIASAVITEVGGLLTHGAVVAREYGIPAVVGVDNATESIPDGARILVNGTEGYVRIL